MDQRRSTPTFAAPPPPPSIVDSRANSSGHHPPHQPAAYAPHPHHPHPHPHPPPPPQSQAPAAIPAGAPPPPPPPATHPHAYAHPPPPPPPPHGVNLPPIQQHHQAYGVPVSAPEPHNLPPFRAHPHHPPAPAPHNPREAHEQYPYPPQVRSGHATPAPVTRTYSHDSAAQRTPTTPAQPVHYPPGVAQDPGQPPPPHPSQPMEHVPHPGYPHTNGVPHHGVPPPGVHLPQNHHEPPPQYMPQAVEAHHPQYGPPQPSPHFMPPGPAPYGPMSANAIQVQRKKQMRATQACEQCRQRKQKCDEGSPCSFCKENNLGCQYRDTPPAKTDKNMERLLAYMESQKEALEEIRNKVNTFDGRLRRMERSSSQGGGPPPVQPRPVHAEEERATEERLLKDHRTAPHKLLLLWPSVGHLLKEANISENEGYVMDAEERGILRLYTRGEGIDEFDGTQAGSAPSPASQRDHSNEGTAAPTVHSPPEGLWGTGFPHTPVSEIRRSDPCHWGGLKPDNTLDLDSSTITELYESYMQHIHIMHPFLDRFRLRTLIDNFIRRYSTGRQFPPKFAVSQQMGYDSERPLKRQRSTGPGADSQSRNHSAERTLPEHSPGNALVYLVLALGKICLHKDPLPGLVQDSKLNANMPVMRDTMGNHGHGNISPMSSAIKTSPGMSPKTTPGAQSTPPADILYGRSRRPSVDGNQSNGPRNLEVIPGLAYYAKATEILGAQADGNDLIHAQMFLLAGLYKGQLARVKESMSWYVMAGRALRSLLDRYQLYNSAYWSAHGDVEKELEKGNRLIKNKRLNLIVLASWTCLQLESDILAELRLPESGIRAIENMLLMPREVPDEESYLDFDPPTRDDNNSRILLFYTAQMWLRRKLNQVHEQMYGFACLTQPLEQVRIMLKGHEEILQGWRQSLPEALKWEDDDPPASDILSARLRAKYWGARYIVNRPFLDYALHIMSHVHNPQSNNSVRDVAKDKDGNPRDKAEIHLFEAIQGFSAEEIWGASMACIEAAMQSTVALDGVPDRLIMTNIHGTAHAQFGNMLVLAATYHDPVASPLVTRKEAQFRALLDRTITFLRRLSPISPTCTTDCSILERVRIVLFEPPPDIKPVYQNEMEPMSATNSFSADS